MVRQNTAKQRTGASPLLKFVKSISDADNARLSSWADFLQRKGVEVEEAKGSHFDLWIDQLRLAGASPGAIDDHRRVVHNLYGFLRRRGVPISLDMWNATNASPTAGSSNGTSAKAASPAVTPRLQLVGGTSTAPAKGPKTSQAVVLMPAAPRRRSAPRSAAPVRDSRLPASYRKKLDWFLATIDTPSTRSNYHTALEQWLLFLAQKGIPVERAGTRARNSWKTELRRRGKNEETRKRYVKYVGSFDNWRLYGTTIATRTRRPSTAEVAAPQSDQGLLEQFFGTIPNLSTRQGHRTAFSQWSEFLAERGETIEHPGPESLESWKAELRSRDKKPKTADTYARYVAAFYDWRRENSSIVAVVPSVMAARRLTRSRPSPLSSNRQPEQPATGGAPDARDEALREVFLGTVLPEPAPLEPAPSSPGTNGKVEASSVVTAEPHALRIPPEALDSLVAKVDVLTTASSAHERRLDTLNAKLAALPAPPAQELVSKRDLEELVARQSKLERWLDDLNAKLAALPAQGLASKLELEYQWEAANAALADKLKQLEALVNHEQADQAEQVAWAQKMNEIAKQVKATLYQRADAATKEVLASQPQAGSSCVEEIELLINGCFKGLETSNADIIEGAAKLDKAPRGRVWADKLHKALLALDSYAQSNFPGDFKAFCKAIPPGHNIVPTTWVASHEPDATVNNGRYREERTFPVPPAVARSGRLFMPEHISLDNGGIAPRLHYYDDRRGQTHKVHIGYIGPHLLSRDTA